MKYGVFVQPNPTNHIANFDYWADRYCELIDQREFSHNEAKRWIKSNSNNYWDNDDLRELEREYLRRKRARSQGRSYINPGEAVANPDFSWSHPNAHQWFLLYRGRSVARVTKNNERSYSAQSEHNAADDEKGFRLLSTAKQYALKLAKGSKGAVKADMLTQAEMLDVVNTHGNKTIIKQHGEAVRIEPTAFSKDRWNIYFADGFSVRNARIPKLKNPKPPKLRGYIDPDKGYAKRIADISKTPTKANVFKALDRLHGASYSAFGVIRKHFNLTEAEWQPLFNEWYNSPSKNPAINPSEIANPVTSFKWERRDNMGIWYALLYNGELLARLFTPREGGQYYSFDITRGGNHSFRATSLAKAKTHAISLVRKLQAYKRTQPSVSHVNKILPKWAIEKHGKAVRVEAAGGFDTAQYKITFEDGYSQETKIPKQRNAVIKLSEREYTKLFDKGGKDQYVHYRIKSTGYEGLTLRYAGERLHPFKKRVADDNRVGVGDVEIIADSQAVRGNPKKKLDSFEDQHLAAWIAKHYRPGEARRVKRNILRFLSYSPNYNYGDRGWSDTVRAAEYVADKSITESDFLSWVR